MKTRRCCTLFQTPRPEPAQRPRGERVHSGDTPREGHLLVGRAASWAAGDEAGQKGAAFAAFQASHGGGELQAGPVALGFPGIPPLTSEVLAEAMNTLESCLRAPKASSGSLADGGGADPVPALAPRPVRGGAATQPDAAVLAEELRKEGVLVAAPRPMRGAAAPTQPDAAVLAEELRKEGVRLVKVRLTHAPTGDLCRRVLTPFRSALSLTGGPTSCCGAGVQRGHKSCAAHAYAVLQPCRLLRPPGQAR